MRKRGQRPRNEKFDEDCRKSDPISGAKQFGWTSRVSDGPHGTNVNYDYLTRYLASKIGKSWNKVYSDICHNHPEWKGWVDIYVHQNVIIDGRFVRDSTSMKLWTGQFYVHPKSGCLERVKK